MRRSPLTCFVFSLLFVACSPSADGPCGEGGELYEDTVASACFYGVIEGGFACPALLPHGYELPDGALLCLDRPVDVPELPEAPCAGRGYSCRDAVPRGPDVDAGQDSGLVDSGLIDSGAEDAGGMVLPPEQCAPACTSGGPPPPPGVPEDACYDGCNWCQCTTAGPQSCTARACGDSGVSFPGDAG